MLTRGDLHIHSTASDGKLTPREIVIYAKRRGIDTIAITDHNSTDGISEASAAGRQYGVAVIPGIEISTKYKGERVHVLGYFRDGKFNHRAFQEILRLLRAHRLNEARDILRGFMYVDGSGDHLSVSEAITLLRTFEAAVVLAHPVRINTKTLASLLRLPFDGIEGKYCRNSSDDTHYFISTALSGFQFYSGGSDFHKNKGGSQTHCLIGDPWLNEMEIQRFLRNSRAVILN
jgi:predicted metal-dependent phosphoesterase TrpH